MLIKPDEFLFPQVLNRLVLDPVMDLCRRWPVLSHSEIAEKLAKGLAGRLFPVLGMVLTLELHEAREKGLLLADTPEARYQFFDSGIAGQKDQKDLVKKYTGLDHLLKYLPLDWHSYHHMMLHRLNLDRADMVRTLSTKCRLSNLTDIQPDCADLHEEGKSVSVLEFAGDQKLVYKPRTLGSDSLINQLTHELNEIFDWKVFYLPNILDRGNYGWQEWISEKSCEDEKDLGLFYRRQGTNLALLYLLGGVDFHSENIIASGSFPVMVDLETIMQPIKNGAHDLTRTGMVPVPQRQFDYSALGFDPYAENRIQTNVWKDWGKDTLHLLPDKVIFKGNHCTPILDEKPVPVTGFKEMVCTEFESALITLAEAFHGKKYLSEMLCEMPIRYIHRPSQIYHEILTASFHPENLKDHKKRGAFIQSQLKILAIPTPRKLLNHEIFVIRAGYLPTCHTRADSRDLWFGEDKITHFFSQTTMTQLQERIRQCLASVDTLAKDLRKTLEVVSKPQVRFPQ